MWSRKDNMTVWSARSVRMARFNLFNFINLLNAKDPGYPSRTFNEPYEFIETTKLKSAKISSNLKN